MKVEISKVSEEFLIKNHVLSWPVWEKEVSEFDWFYDQVEECYLLEGWVEVLTDTGELFEFGEGDFVTFPRGLNCRWKVKEPVRKHYRFREVENDH